jgi:ribonucleoside-triphosphate reductase
MTVEKRDGQIKEFDPNKIITAISKAAKSCKAEISQDTLNKILKYVTAKVSKLDEPINVEDIQDAIEEALMKYNLFETEICFHDYRKKRETERFKKLKITKEITQKLNAENVVNQNANLDESSFGGRKGEAESALLKQMALDYYISPKFAKNHINNRIYIHDLDSYVIGMHNCLSIPFDELLRNGFKTRQVFIRPAGSINTAYQLVAVLFQLQSLQQFGGVAATHFDWTMVPYVRKSFYKHYKDGKKWLSINKKFELSKEKVEQTSINDKKVYTNKKARKFALEMIKKELNQAAEGLLHNLNSLQSRSGNQLPFSSINYGTCTLPEGRLVIRSILESSIKGVGNGATSIFPCQIFQLMNGVNTSPKDKNYDLFELAIECTSKRLYPNYVNCDWTNDTGFNKNDPRTYPSTMGCRTWNGVDINAQNKELSHLKDGRGNIAPATIILPTLAMEAKKKAEKEQKSEYIIDYFMNILERAISDCKDELIERFNWICAQNPASAKFMYENNTFFSYGDDFKNEGIRGALKHGTLAIGQLGMAECLQILIGCDHCYPKGMEVAKRIESLFKSKCTEYKENYKLNFGVYYSPAESLCFTAMSKFKKKYGVIPNVSDRDYFTNSIHVPVWKEIDPIEKINIESQLTGYSSAGCITYVEIGDKAKYNLEALKDLVLYAKNKDIPYFALNLPLSHCTECGSDENIDFDASCPCCGADPEKVEHLARVTGYLSTDFRHFNKGKQSETRDRFTHVNKWGKWKTSR